MLEIRRVHSFLSFTDVLRISSFELYQWTRTYFFSFYYNHIVNHESRSRILNVIRVGILLSII